MASDWYQQPDHPYHQGMIRLLDQLLQWSDLEELDLLIANGTDPFHSLQVGLNRQVFSWQPPTIIGETLSTQRIYSFSRHSLND